MRDVLTICVYCGFGYGLYLKEEFGRITGSSPSRNLTTPLIRKNGRLTPATWDEPLALTARGSWGESGGGDNLAGIASAKCTNEENYLQQKFTRAVLQTKQYRPLRPPLTRPHRGRSGHRLGSGAMPNSINEIERAEVILVSGSNTTEAHLQIARRMLEDVDRGAKLIVTDPPAPRWPCSANP